jgi:DNA-directed RNA polymerase specialized sigma24 family protein
MGEDRILARLFSGSTDTESAWREFLTSYSNLFLKIIWQFEHDRDEVMEKYLYVCSKLSANNFAVLKRYREQSGDNPPRLEHWLAVVVRNMCVDAHRSAHGRPRLPKAMHRLSDFDRTVFKMFYWMGLTVEEISHRVGSGLNGTMESVNRSLARIERVLTRLPEPGKPDPVFIPFDESTISGRDEDDGTETDELLQRCLTMLPDQERLVVRLRFWEDMTAKQIARLVKITPEHRVYTILQNALKLMRNEAAKTH